MVCNCESSQIVLLLLLLWCYCRGAPYLRWQGSSGLHHMAATA
jgi:hypothetical protein